MNDNKRDAIIVGFGQRVKSIRQNKKLTQIELAASIGIDSRQLMRIENGQTNTTLTVIYQLAEVLEVSITELFAFTT